MFRFMDNFVRTCAAVVVAVWFVLGGVAASAGTATPSRVRAVERIERLIWRGESLPLRSYVVRASSAAPLAVRPGRFVARRSAGVRESRRLAPEVATPIASSAPVVSAGATASGFAGLTDADQFNAGTGAYTGSQFEVEPPDPALCAGNGFVVEAVNGALGVYRANGTMLGVPIALNQFLRLSPELSATGVHGPFVSNPRCYFDRDTQRWYLTALEIDSDPSSGNLYTSSHSALMLAVSRSGDPTAGYDVYGIDTTDNANGGCPCFGDRPLLGADANAVVISTNEFDISGSIFNGAQIYALSKAALATGNARTVVHVDVGALADPEGISWHSLAPAVSPDTSAASRLAGGTEFLASAVDSTQQGAASVVVWALTDTASLKTATPNLALQHIVLGSEAYVPPPPAIQRPGPAPLASALRLPIESISTGDDRITAAVYAGGRLWSTLGTGVQTSAAANTTRAGVAYFSIAPAIGASGLNASIVSQGYLAVSGQNLIAPSIAVNAAGNAIVAATLSGPAFFPSAISATPLGPVTLAGTGAGPNDGYSGYSFLLGAGDFGYYPCCGGNVARYGAYSAAIADSDGSIWTVTEYTSARRTIWANWGTFINHVR